MSKKNTNTKRTPKNVVEVQAPPAPVVVLSRDGATQDKLKGRIGARTHAIHRVLLEAHIAGAKLSTKQITERATALLGRACNATGAHLNTMKLRKFIVRVDGAWSLTAEGRAAVDAE